MGKLSILGAQRVKALTEILEQQRKDARQKASDETPTISRNEARGIALAEMGSDAFKAYTEAMQLQERAVELDEQLYDYGIAVKASVDDTYSRKDTRFSKQRTKRENEIADNGLKAKLNAIDREFTDKKNALWLCETLEEAKAIVFGEETE